LSRPLPAVNRDQTVRPLEAVKPSGDKARHHGKR
jgi:hypothetical protein